MNPFILLPTIMPNFWKYLTAFFGAFIAAKITMRILIFVLGGPVDGYYELLVSSLLWLFLAAACVSASCARAAWARLFDFITLMVFLAGMFFVYLSYTIQSQHNLSISSQIQDDAAYMSNVTAVIIFFFAIIIGFISKAIKSSIKQPNTEVSSSSPS